MRISDIPIYYFHIIAFFAGFILDAILGDPYCFPHPVRIMGMLISKLERHYLGEKKAQKIAETEEASQTQELMETEEASQAIEHVPNEKKREQGRETVLIVLFCTLLVTDTLLIGGYYIHPILGCVIETIMTYQALAAKCLVVESRKVYKALTTGTIEDARKAVSMIVGRDTAQLDEAGVTRAAVETVAENASDGVIAPMIYLAIGGPILGFAYKAINTMDSMIGYKNERYIDYGRAAARLDDVVNFLPSRISALLMILACYIASEAMKSFPAI